MKKKKKVFLESKWEINLIRFLSQVFWFVFLREGKREREGGFKPSSRHNQKGFFRSSSDVVLGRIVTNRPKKVNLRTHLISNVEVIDIFTYYFFI